MTLNREHFEAWLFSQPKEKVFFYKEGQPNDPNGCALCNYFRDNFKGIFSIGGSTFRFETKETIIPVWLQDLLEKAREPWYQTHQIGEARFTAGELQTTYLSLFPNTLSDTPSLPGAKAGILSSEQRESTQGKIDSHQTKTQK